MPATASGKFMAGRLFPIWEFFRWAVSISSLRYHSNHLDESDHRTENNACQKKPPRVQPVIQQFTHQQADYDSCRNDERDLGIACPNDRYIVGLAALVVSRHSISVTPGTSVFRKAAFDLWFTCLYHQNAGWSSLVARWAHNPKVGGSNPPPATKQVPDYKRLPSQPEGVFLELAHNLLTEFQPRIWHLHDPPFCLVRRQRTKQVVELLHHPAVVVSDQVCVVHRCP